MKKRILIADDHAIIRDGLRQILDDTDDLEIVGEAANGSETVAQVREQDWDLLILDVSMPGRGALELIKQINGEKPRLPILVFSMHPEEQYAVRALRAGASGYLNKEADGTLLVAAIRKVANGGIYLSPFVSEQMARELMPGGNSELLPHKRLSDREFQILCMLAGGKAIGEIACELCVSVKTVSTHKTRILHKMGMHNAAELIRYAIEHELV